MGYFLGGKVLMSLWWCMQIRPDLREALEVCADGTSRKLISQQALQLLQRLSLMKDCALGMPTGE